MDKVTFTNKIQEIGSCEDEATRRELLTQLGEDMESDFDRLETLENTNNQLTSENESLRSANMKLFLRIGDHKEDKKDDFKEEEKRNFKDLFDEKGRIK